MKLALIKDGNVEVVELPKKHNYTDIKALLEIESPIDCIEREIGGKIYDLWIDDEGALKEDDVITAITFHEGAPCEFVLGRILVSHHNEEGAMTGLDIGEITSISKEMKQLASPESVPPIMWVGQERKFREDGIFLKLGV